MCQLSALGCQAGQLNGWLNVVSDSKCNSSDSHATDGNPRGKGSLLAKWPYEYGDAVEALTSKNQHHTRWKETGGRRVTLP